MATRGNFLIVVLPHLPSPVVDYYTQHSVSLPFPHFFRQEAEEGQPTHSVPREATNSVT